MGEKLYILGHPVAHSKSPDMHNAAYRALGLPWEYGFADRETEMAANDFLNACNWRACNVTMPWKPLAFAFASVRSEAAELARGANVLVNWDGRIYADNTDGKGCVAYLERCGVAVKGSIVSVCGTGPTSLAIAHACARGGASRVNLFGRDAARTQQAVDEYHARLASAAVHASSGATGETSLTPGTYDAAGESVLAASSIIIDATPLGMKPGDPAPFDTRVLSAGQTVLDVVYGHGETALLAAARSAGCVACDGAGMLVAQAVETVRDLSEVTGCFDIPAHLDLFAIMAQAAGFDLA